MTDTILIIDDIAWNFEESDLDWQSIALKTLVNDADWNSSYDGHWSELYDATKSTEFV
jgi:hypothetical protein